MRFKFPLGNSFLYEIKNSSEEYFLYFNNNTMNYTIFRNKIYFEFYPINCEIEVENYNNRTKLNKYKDFFYCKEQNKNEYSFKIKRVDYNIQQPCLFYASSYSVYNNKILIKNIPQYSFFEYGDNLEYLYFHYELENDLKIFFGMNHSDNDSIASYSVYYQINDSIKTLVDIYYNNSYITIESKKVKKYCRDEKEVCMIKFDVYSSYNKESVFKIQVTTIIKEDYLIFVICFFIGITSIILFFSILQYIIKNKQKKDLFALKVNHISFREEKAKRRNKYEDGLLY